MKEVVRFIRLASPETPIIVDCKIGDVEHTMAAYLQMLFNDVGADAVVMNPYMGPNVWKDLTAFEDRAALILVRTSNPGSAAFQMQPTGDGVLLWERILASLVDDWQRGYELVPIMASTSDDDTLSRIRTLIPDDMPNICRRNWRARRQFVVNKSCIELT